SYPLFPPYDPPRHLHSFPTRRSSDLTVGDGLPVVAVGVVNLSPESFHAGSVYTRDDDLLDAALGMVEAGAALIDVGARSTAPYLDRKSTRLNSSHDQISYAVFCLKKK